jgi:hypothetical protein
LAKVTGEDEPDALLCCCETVSLIPEPKERLGVGRPMLDPNDITDIKSTGRKRAAMVAPIFDGMVCEWAGLKYAGGGVQPIVGCLGTLITEAKGSGERHHGPDKNVLNNSVGVNLHRICQNCHKRWHALNDPYYAPVRPDASEQYLPLTEHVSFAHDPITQASDEDKDLSVDYWMTRTEKRGSYPVELPE